MAWIERRVMHHGDRDSQSFIYAAIRALGADGTEMLESATPGDISDWLFRGLNNIDALFERALVDDAFCLFGLMNRLVEDQKGDRESIVTNALRTLLLCAKITELLAADPVVQTEIRRGGSERISLAYWRDTLARRSDTPLEEFLLWVIENLILSQHFSVAAGRFDGATQRLRLTIEEEGLVPLVGEPWEPAATPDQLFTALSLMADCGMIGSSSEDGTFFLS